MKIGVLTGGGDCPGLNGVIRAIVNRGISTYDDTILGYWDGWRGPLEGRSETLTLARVRDILPLGGTILGTSRTNIADPERLATVIAQLQADNVDALIPIGGEDTLGVALRLAEAGVQVIGVPKTIDNDLSGTDVTFGFTTAVQVAVEAVDRVRTTSASHHRGLVVEVMGRHAGWIALQTGLACSAVATLIPEVPFDLDAICGLVAASIQERRDAIVVVAEGALPRAGTIENDQGGAVDEFGHVQVGGIAEFIAKEITRRSGVETRSVVLGHVQRGGTPTAYDRVLATRFGVAAVDGLHQGKTGVMVSAQGSAIGIVPLAEATGTLRTVPRQLIDEVGAILGIDSADMKYK
ncbi:MAG: 6-phosphofructokinase [Propionibacteriaceae bacterium]|jgi:6-phosphofructokinase 1|nr:6-phosphofructokinase [Propionibacteriaceae bacterium]